MHPAATNSSFAALAERLPFGLDDFEHVNSLFLDCRAAYDRSTEVALELWTYCFVRRYFSLKLAKDPQARAADLDALMDTVYERIRRAKASVDGRYASWVSVVCRNAFLNYVRDRRVATEDGQVEVPADWIRGQTRLHQHLDHEIAIRVVRRAVANLPAHIRPVAYMRLIDDLGYDEISERVGRPVPTVRAYFHKAVTRLRRDPAIRHVLGKKPAASILDHSQVMDAGPEVS